MQKKKNNFIIIKTYNNGSLFPVIMIPDTANMNMIGRVKIYHNGSLFPL